MISSYGRIQIIGTIKTKQPVVLYFLLRKTHIPDFKKSYNSYNHPYILPSEFLTKDPNLPSN